MKQEARIKSETEKDSEFSSWKSACLLFRGRGMTEFLESVLLRIFLISTVTTKVSLS